MTWLSLAIADAQINCCLSPGQHPQYTARRIHQTMEDVASTEQGRERIRQVIEKLQEKIAFLELYAAEPDSEG